MTLDAGTVTVAPAWQGFGPVGCAAADVCMDLPAVGPARVFAPGDLDGDGLDDVAVAWEGGHRVLVLAGVLVTGGGVVRLFEGVARGELAGARRGPRGTMK